MFFWSSHLGIRGSQTKIGWNHQNTARVGPLGSKLETKSYIRDDLPRDGSVTLYPSEGCFSYLRGPFRTKDPRYENCSHFCDLFRFGGIEQFRFLGVDKCRNISLKYVPIYRKLHRIRIRHSKYKSIIQNTPTTPKYFQTVQNIQNIIKQIFI